MGYLFISAKRRRFDPSLLDKEAGPVEPDNGLALDFQLS
jgi:hypothetical protein